MFILFLISRIFLLLNFLGERNRSGRTSFNVGKRLRRHWLAKGKGTMVMVQQVFSVSFVHLSYHLFKGRTSLPLELGEGNDENEGSIVFNSM